MATPTDAPNEPPESPDDGPWDAPPRRPPIVTSPVLSVDGFEGPLDWLLEMARAQKIDLARLSILALVEAFADVMDAALRPRLTAQKLSQWAAWTVMAAQLTELRSRLLLPADVPDGQAARAEAEMLRQHWLSRTEMAEATDWLDQRLQLGRDVFARGRPQPVGAGQGVGPVLAMTGDLRPAEDEVDDLAVEEGDEFTELLRACLVALRLPSRREVYQLQRSPFWGVGDALRRISQMLPTMAGGMILEVFLPDVTQQDSGQSLHRRAALAATLVAGLELAHGGTIALEQESIWTPIMVGLGGERS